MSGYFRWSYVFREGTSCDLKRLSVANGGQFVFLPFSDSHSICWEAKNDHFYFKLIVNHTQTNSI